MLRAADSGPRVAASGPFGLWDAPSALWGAGVCPVLRMAVSSPFGLWDAPSALIDVFDGAFCSKLCTVTLRDVAVPCNAVLCNAVLCMPYAVQQRGRRKALSRFISTIWQTCLCSLNPDYRAFCTSRR